MRVKFKDAKHIAKEELVELGDFNIKPNMKPGCWARMLGIMVVPFTGFKRSQLDVRLRDSRNHQYWFLKKSRFLWSVTKKIDKSCMHGLIFRRLSWFEIEFQLGRKKCNQVNIPRNIKMGLRGEDKTSDNVERVV